MKIGYAALLGTALIGTLLSGCMSSGSNRTCEVFSPVAVATPTTQDDQRVKTNSTGDPTGGQNNLQDCGSQ